MRKTHIVRSALVASLMASTAVVSANAQIDEIIITAEKRETNLADTSVAASAFNNETMDTLGITNASDIAAYTPSMSYTNFPNKISIRGVGRLTNALGTEPGVAIYRDGIYINEAASVSDNSFMTDSIVILRGPQILYGRNAIGGASLITTKRPTEDFLGRARAIVGSDNYNQIGLALSGPVTDNFRVLGAYMRDTGGGHYTNTESSAPLGGNNQERFTAAFDWDISENLNWWLNFEHNDWSDVPQTPGYNMSEWASTSPENGAATGCTLAFLPAGPPYYGAPYFPGNPGGAFLGGSGAFNCIPQFSADYLTITRNAQFGQGPNPQLSDPFTVSQNDPGVMSNVANSWTSHITYDTENWEFKYIFGTLEYGWRSEGDTDGTANPDIRRIGGAEQNEKFSQHELVAASDLGGDIEFIFGAFLYHDENDQPLWGREVTNPTLANPFAIDFSGPLPLPLDGPAWTGWGGAGNPDGYYYFQNAKVETDSWAVYGQADFFVNEEITIKAGLRYTSDEKSAYEDKIAIIDGQGAYAQFFNDFVSPLVGPAPNAWFLTSAVGSPPTRASFTSGLVTQTHEAEWDSLDWSLGIDYQPNDDHLLYAKVTTGYKAGGFQLGPVAASAEVEEETLVAYEVGHKGTLMDGRFQSNTTAYRYDYDNFQAPLGFIDDLGLNGTMLVSAEKAKQWGIEWDGQWAVNDAWMLYSTYSYMDTEIVEMGQAVVDVQSICSQDPVINAASLALWAPAGAQAAAGCTPEDITGVNIDGNEMVKAPKNKFSLNSIYTWNVGDGNELGLTLSYIHTGEQFSSIFNRSETQVPSWNRMDARLSYFMPDSDVRIIGYVRNIADEQYMDHIDMSVAGMGNWVYGNQLVGGGLAYRTFGIQIDVNF